MALREIIKLPDPRLRLKSEDVSVFDAELQRLVSDMAETMQVAKGIGLAAIQVAVPQRVLVIDIGDLDEEDHYIEGDEASESRLADRRKISNLEIYVNPVIVESEGTIEYEEGCLSVPGVYSNVTRKNSIKLRYQDLKGRAFEGTFDGLRAIVLQHEMDHLDGVVFTDRIGPMQRMMLLNKYAKLQKANADGSDSGQDDDEG